MDGEAMDETEKELLLTYEAGSLHCFNWDAKKWVVF